MLAATARIEGRELAASQRSLIDPLLPVVIKWEPVTGIALLIGASSVSAICAAYLPILFGIPGGSGSQATVLDGYPMAKRG